MRRTFLTHSAQTQSKSERVKHSSWCVGEQGLVRLLHSQCLLALTYLDPTLLVYIFQMLDSTSVSYFVCVRFKFFINSLAENWCFKKKIYFSNRRILAQDKAITLLLLTAVLVFSIQFCVLIKPLRKNMIGVTLKLYLVY